MSSPNGGGASPTSSPNATVGSVHAKQPIGAIPAKPGKILGPKPVKRVPSKGGKKR